MFTTNKLAGLIFIVFLVIYGLSAGKFATGYADSDELITAGYLFGVAHPPGYGLNVVLIGIWQRVWAWLFNPAWAANMLAGVFHSLCLGLVYLTGISVWELTKGKVTKLEKWAGLWGIFLLGFNSLFWLNSAVIEVMSLGNLLMMLFIYLTVKWIKIFKLTNEINFRWMWLSFGVFGIAICHLQSLIINLAGLTVWWFGVFGTNKFGLTRLVRLWILNLFAVIVGVGIGAILLFGLNANNAEMSWSFEKSINGLMKMMLRKDYQGYFPDKNLSVANAYVGNIAKNLTIVKFEEYAVRTWNHFGGLPAIFIIGGLIWLIKNKSVINFGLIVWLLVSGPLFGTYTALSPNDSIEHRMMTGVTDRQWLFGYVILGLVAMLGGMEGANLIKLMFNHNRLKKVMVVIVTLALFVGLYISNKEMGVQTNNKFVNNLANKILTESKPNSVVLCMGDISCFSLYYLSLVEKVRPDVVVIGSVPKIRQNFLDKNPQYIGYYYKDNPYFFAQLVAWNVNNRPTYITDVNDFYINYLGFFGDPFYLIPSGFKYQVIKELPVKIDGQIDYGSDWIKKVDIRDSFAYGINDYLASQWQVSATLLANYSQMDTAKKLLDQAMTLNEEYGVVQERLLDIADGQLSNPMKFNSYTDTDYIVMSKRLMGEGKWEEAYNQARKAFYINPIKSEPLDLILEILRKFNYLDHIEIVMSHRNDLVSN